MKRTAQHLQTGFTLIELLIVIALLGALAIGLIGALDPLEQFKKGADTGTRDVVSQLQTAMIRYYAVKNEMPWCDPTATSNPCGSGSDEFVGDAMDPLILNIIDAGEIKANFSTVHATQLGKITIFVPNLANTDVKVCYTPIAKSFQVDPNTRYNPVDGEISDGDNILCKSADATNGVDCAWCIE